MRPSDALYVVENSLHVRVVRDRCRIITAERTGAGTALTAHATATSETETAIVTTKTPIIDNCRLCRARRELQHSHILPSWSYERILQGPEGRQLAPVFVDTERGTSVLLNNQITEHLLCFDCEQRFCKWENYVSQIVVQDDLTFPWLAAVRVGNGMDRIVDSSAIDIDTVVRFACSIAWRGSVCSKMSARLGPYEQGFANFLLDTGPKPAEVCVVVQLLEKKSLQRALVPPQYRSRSGCHAHWFLVCGVLFQVFVGNRIARPLREGCLGRRRVVILSDGEDVMNLLGPSILESAPKGKLARMDLYASQQR